MTRQWWCAADEEDVMVVTRAHDTVTTARVWQVLAKATFAVVSEVTPTGEPRSSGVLYGLADRRLYVVVGKDSWKARHFAVDGRR
jgi:hypothetical protein